MGADIEGEITRPEELPIQPIETAQAPGLAIVDRKRAREAERAGEIATPVAGSFEIGRGH
jgi:hypothetical protein